ncbi:MAG: NTP transferase domain-containing protein [Vicinamibacterales bacterium]|nr:NTP transferase domain-containing protein [Vicinamibacterales bacterium]
MTPTETLIVLQARMGSRRLPGKSLSRVGAHSLLGTCIRRLRSAGGIPVMVATTTGAEDDAIAAEAGRYGAEVCRGSSHDVLARFVLASRIAGATRIIRATADNPAVDIDAVARVLRVMDREQADHVVEGGLPYGAAVEAVRVTALERASRFSCEGDDREHVTPYLTRNTDRFVALRPAAPAALCRPDLRLTIDTRDDLRYMREVFACLGRQGDLAPLSTVIAAADRLRAAATLGAA